MQEKSHKLIKPLCEVSSMHPSARVIVMNFFRQLVGSGKVTGNLGIEASEECLESLYNKGYIKIIYEPDRTCNIKGRVMLYNTKAMAYDLAENISLLDVQ